MSNYNFKVDLKGIIRLLSDNLYSGEHMFLRELLQAKELELMNRSLQKLMEYAVNGGVSDLWS